MTEHEQKLRLEVAKVLFGSGKSSVSDCEALYRWVTNGDVPAPGALRRILRPGRTVAHLNTRELDEIGY